MRQRRILPLLDLQPAAGHTIASVPSGPNRGRLVRHQRLVAADRNAGRPQAGIVERLERIHQSAATRAARSAALNRLPFQVDAAAALRAVERAAAAGSR
ncbi:MAG TPA: hypothetical protein VF142_20765, partial [Longimicrobium sp.]